LYLHAYRYVISPANGLFRDVAEVSWNSAIDMTSVFRVDEWTSCYSMALEMVDVMEKNKERRGEMYSTTHPLRNLKQLLSPPLLLHPATSCYILLHPETN
jgi:hypothetical protein